MSIHVRPHPENRAVLAFDDGVELSGDALHTTDGHIIDGHVALPRD